MNETNKKSLLGQVPHDWTITTVGELGKWGGGSTPRRSEADYWNGSTPWVSPKDMKGSVIRRTQDYVTDEALTATSLTRYEPGSVMVVFRSGILRHTFPVATADMPFTVNQDIKVLNPSSAVHERFAFYLLDCIGPLVLRRATKVGTTVESVDTSTFMDLKVGLPTRSKQRRIAEVLDTVDAAIQQTDAVIAKQQQVKTGLLQDLLTRGLDEQGRLRDPERHPEQFKDSPLGRIPKAWELLTIDEIASSAIDGPFGSKLKTSHYVEQPGVRVVRLQNVGNGVFDDADKAYVSEEHAEALKRHEVKGGDLLVASLGDTTHPVGRACMYPAGAPHAINKADCFRIRTDPKVAMPPFVMHALNCSYTRKDVNGLIQGVTRDRINLTNLKQVRLPIAPLGEQERVVEKVAAQSECIDSEYRHAGKLKSMKSGLMQDLLTGAVRVPEAEAAVQEVVA